MENQNEEIRYVGKRFKCHNCNKKFTKLVRANEVSSECENCQNISFEISEEEYKRKLRPDIDQAPRMVFTKSQDKKVIKEEKKIPNNSSESTRNPNLNFQRNTGNFNGQSRTNINFNVNTNTHTNVNGQANARSRSTHNNTNNGNPRQMFNLFNNNFFENQFNIGFGDGPRISSNINDFIGGFMPFFSSPFTNNVNHHNFQSDVFDPIFDSFGTSFNNVFRDNFSSNFRSNFFNNDIINMVIQESFRNAQEHKKPPVAKEVIKKLNRFKMNEKYCKRNDKGEIEQPTCSVCLSEIKMEEETILIPCGHLYHSPCILSWFDRNNTCPVCRFELPPEMRN